MENINTLVNNRFVGFQKKFEKSGKKLHPTHEIVNEYYKLRGMEKAPKEAFVGQFAYARLAVQARRLLHECGENLEDALWCLDKMNYKAKKGDYEWTISTCMKHDLGWGTK